MSKIEMKELEEICNNILNTEQRNGVIHTIKQDIANMTYDISLNELEFLSNNIFEYVCLIIKEIDKQEILEYISYKNNKFNDTLSDTEKKSFLLYKNLEDFNEIISKNKKLIIKLNESRTYKSTRRVDPLGRVTLPSDMRDIIGLDKKDPIKFVLLDDGILVKKLHDSCMVCGSDKHLIGYKEKRFCQKCLKELGGIYADI